eukprot:gnl/TRDRNA2_/TRDRNA2_196655_c0_seq1.p1 gnl/TRDRNA2_/TRDRNA2_196655_c0~~gnl/TRDRNA2_/TRDRNA2_196655_c0_seq1.p1  ORF type:complete len:218 (+),score=47.72 gnl/TRDRNA2_/TRDRNA2_196655_c0_seq1:181-834(+)
MKKQLQAKQPGETQRALIQKLEHRCIELDKKVQEQCGIERRARELEARCEQLEAERSEFETRADRWEEHCAWLQEEVQELDEARMVAWKTRVEELEAKCEQLETERGKLEVWLQKPCATHSSHGDTGGLHDVFPTGKDLAQQRIDELESQVARLNGEVESYKQRLAEAEQANQNHVQHNALLHANIEDLGLVLQAAMDNFEKAILTIKPGARHLHTR